MQLTEDKKVTGEKLYQWARGYILSLVRKLTKGKYLYNFEDLVSSGLLGYVDGLSRYDESKGCIKSYLKIRIYGQIIDEIRGKFHQTGVTRKGEKLYYEYNYYKGKNGFVQKDTYEESDFKDAISSICKFMSNRDTKIVHMYYFEGLDSTEIAQQFNLHRSVVCRILKSVKISLAMIYRNGSEDLN